jgi:hypothetical protein
MAEGVLQGVAPEPFSGQPRAERVLISGQPISVTANLVDNFSRQLRQTICQMSDGRNSSEYPTLEGKKGLNAHRLVGAVRGLAISRDTS